MMNLKKKSLRVYVCSRHGGQASRSEVYLVLFIYHGSGRMAEKEFALGNTKKKKSSSRNLMRDGK